MIKAMFTMKMMTKIFMVTTLSTNCMPCMPSAHLFNSISPMHHYFPLRDTTVSRGIVLNPIQHIVLNRLWVGFKSDTKPWELPKILDVCLLHIFMGSCIVSMRISIFWYQGVYYQPICKQTKYNQIIVMLSNENASYIIRISNHSYMTYRNLS